MAETRNRMKARGRLLVGLLIAVGVTFPMSVRADDGVTATAASSIAVDLRDDVCRAVSPASVGYSPKWCGVTEAGAYVLIEKVVRAGMYDATTNTLAAFAGDAEGTYPVAVADGDERCVRLIHRVYSAGGVEIGEPLVSDMSFGYQSAAGTAFVADSRTNSLQLAAGARKPIGLAYSTAWATNTASVTLAAVKLSGKGGTEVATNAMFAASADAEGVVAMRYTSKGWWRLFCQLNGESGETLLEYLTDEFMIPGGIVLNFK